jgi:imidazoleglycerol phosphate synthase glutamine amidotransferase subunit HisH
VSSKKNMFAVRALSRTLLMLPSSRRVESMDATVTMDQMGWNAVDVQQSDFALGRGLI